MSMKTSTKTKTNQFAGGEDNGYFSGMSTTGNGAVQVRILS
jgi:hypothetical protein